jgi:hypothetical protein
MATAPAAGWYPDPASPNSSRWWDGAAWTDHVQPAVMAAVPQVAEVAQIPEPARRPNLGADGVPFSLFADSVVNPAVLAPIAGPSTQEDWHNTTGRGTQVRRQVSGSVSLSTAGASSKRISDPYERNWIAGLAIVLAVLSIPALALRVAWELPPLTQSILAGAPIAISLLARAMGFRRGRRIVLPLVATLISAAVVAAGFLVPPAILVGAVDWVIGLLPS